MSVYREGNSSSTFAGHPSNHCSKNLNRSQYQNLKSWTRPDHGNRKFISVREVGEVVVLESLTPPQGLHQHQGNQDPWFILSWTQHLCRMRWLHHINLSPIFESCKPYYQLLVCAWPRLCQGEGHQEEGRPMPQHVFHPTSDLEGNSGEFMIWTFGGHNTTW